MHVRSLSLSMLTGAALLCSTSAWADNTLRHLLSSGATLGSSYLTSSDHKRVAVIQDDASSFVASGGAIRGAYIEAELRRLREEHPTWSASDMELAEAILVSPGAQVQPE